MRRDRPRCRRSCRDPRREPRLSPSPFLLLISGEPTTLERGAGHSIKTAHAEEQQRPDVLKQRQEWFGAQLDLDPRKLVFIDETGASTNLARKGGRCDEGDGCASAFPTATTRPSRWSPACAFPASWPRRLSISR